MATVPEQRGGAARSALLVLLLLALLGVVAFLLSERNARQWFLVWEGGALNVKKGIFAPMGRTSFKTDDPGQALAYSPLRPPAGWKGEEERIFEDRAALDTALYELLAKWARDDLATEKPESVERALSWLARADRLAGLTSVQREDLRTLRAESGYFEARGLLDRAADALRQARERLRLTSSTASPHAGEAGEALRRLEPTLDELYQASRALGAGVTQAPPAPPPRAEGQPAPAPQPGVSPAPMPPPAPASSADGGAGAAP